MNNVVEMFSPRYWILVVAVCLSMCGCANMDDRVNREILVSTIWSGERFVPDWLDVADSGEVAEEVLYRFGADGIMSVYEYGDDVPMPLEAVRYIYIDGKGEIVIEGYGLFYIKKITVDRLSLEGETGNLELRFYAETDDMDFDREED